MSRILFAVLLMCYVFTLSAENLYTKDEIDLKLELQQDKITSKLDAIERENNSIDHKIAAQDKMIAHQDKEIETLKYIFGILLSVIGVIAALGSYLINKKNKERSEELEKDLEHIKEEALEQLEHIKELAKLEIRIAQADLKEIRYKAKALLDELDAEKNNLANK